MSVNNGNILPPVSITDLQQVFGVILEKTATPGERIITGDLGTLIRGEVGDIVGEYRIVSRNDINLWAKYKPVRLNVKDTLTGQWNAVTKKWLSTAHWWKADGMCGLSTITATEFGEPFGSANPWSKKLVNGQLGWTYNKPAGSGSTPNSPYRLQDFYEYFHNAEAPYGEIGSTTIHIQNNGNAEIQWDVNNYYIEDSPSLQLADFAFTIDGHSYALTDMYLGIIIWRGTTYYLFTTSETFSGESLNITIQNARPLEGSWSMMPFFTAKKVNANGRFDANGAFISMAGTTPYTITFTTEGGGTGFMGYPDGEWNETHTRIDYIIPLKNETSSAYTIPSVTIAIYGGSYEGSSLATKTLTNVSVPVGGTDLEGYISINKSSYSYDSYWIVVRLNWGPASSESKHNEVQDNVMD